MLHCPNCKAEYRDGFIKCNDCDIELIAGLPQQTVDVSVSRIKTRYIFTFAVVYAITVVIFIIFWRNSAEEMSVVNRNFNVMAKRAADSIAEVDKLKTENNNLQTRLQSMESSQNKNATSSATVPSVKQSVETTSMQDIVKIQKFEYKNFNYSNYTGRGAQLKVLIHNTTKKNFSVNPGCFQAITDKNRTIPHSTSILVSYEYATKEKIGFDLVDLVSGTQTDGTIFFELRDVEKIVKIIYDYAGDGLIEIPIVE